MPPESLQLLIRRKLANGTCDGVITKDEWVSEGVSLAGGPKPVHLHVKCFHLWQEERHAMPPPSRQTPPRY
jgi:hypothetical protein